MSAPSLVLPAAPATGHAAASKRGATTSDADFAGLLDATPAEEPKAVAPVSTKTATEAAPIEDVVTETVVDAAPASDEAIAIPTPVMPAPPPVVLDAKTDVEVAAVPAPTAKPLDLAPTAPETAVPAEAPAEDAPPAPGADLPDLAALQPEQPKAPTPAPTPAAPSAPPVAPPPPRAARPVDETAVAETPEDAPAAAPAPADTAPAPVPVPAEAPRTRDVIERAQTGRAEATSTGAAADPEAAQSDAPGIAARANPTSPAPAVPRPAASAEVAPTAAALVEADTPVAAAPAATTETEARPLETAASLALSTLSHATIQTTAQIAAQIVKKLEGRSTRFEMALTPEGLGNVDVSLDIDADGKLLARMAFDNPIAATELRGRVDELRRQLQDAGFTVADDAFSFAERDASTGQGGSAFDRPDPRNARAFGAASRMQSDADRIAMPAAWIPLTLTPDRVDMKV